MRSWPPKGFKQAISRQWKCRFQSFSELFMGAFFTLILAGCSGTKDVQSHSEGAAAKTVFFTSGDPSELIKGATLEAKSPIQLEDIKMFNGFGLLTNYSFVQNNPAKKLEAPEVSEKPGMTEVKSIAMHKFIQTGAHTYIYSNGESANDLGFREIDGRLEWVRAFGHRIEALHYSRSTTINAFSLLGSYQDPVQGQVLLNLLFFKPEVAPSLSMILLEGTSRLYSYLFGPNVVARWQQTKTLYLCGDIPNAWLSKTLAARDQWQAALGERFRLKIDVLASYPPFSDLNNSCLYAVDQYVMDPREDFYFLARTFFSAYLPDGALIDGDIFVFQAEFAKMETQNSEEVIEAARTRTLTHELGHLLGLHHMFDGTPSIMSYDRDDDHVTDYDKEAVQALYQ